MARDTVADRTLWPHNPVNMTNTETDTLKGNFMTCELHLDFQKVHGRGHGDTESWQLF